MPSGASLRELLSHCCCYPISLLSGVSLRPTTGLEDPAVSPDRSLLVVSLFQKALDAFRVEHSDAQLFELFRPELRKPLFSPVRNRTQPLFDLAAKYLQLALQLAIWIPFLISGPITSWSRISFRIGTFLASVKTM